MIKSKNNQNQKIKKIDKNQKIIKNQNFNKISKREDVGILSIFEKFMKSLKLCFFSKNWKNHDFSEISWILQKIDKIPKIPKNW